jgi:hypothetical protein
MMLVWAGSFLTNVYSWVLAVYQINNGQQTAFKDGDRLTIGKEDPIGTTYNIKLTGTNGEGAASAG